MYEADTASLATGEVDEAMQALRDVIERRINLFGVSEALVQVEQASALAGEGARAERLIVELPGITDLEEAKKLIGATPSLEFKLVDPSATGSAQYVETGLTGRYLKRAHLEFQNGNGAGLANEPVTLVDFNEEGKELFAKITGENVGRQLAIFLDGALVSEPVIREAIPGGTAVISGNFSPEEARELVRNLNIGALPVPIHLASTETVGATLGKDTLNQGVRASLYGIGAVMLFLIAWYRLPGLIASVALAIYLVLNMGIFLAIPVTLTAAGIAGFILTSGMAVDANILIFERMKDELRRGKSVREAIREGVARAWLPIRDGNLTGIISAVVLFWFGSAGIEGFALTLAIGIVTSMFTAIIVTRTLLLAIAPAEVSSRGRLLFLSGTDRA